MIDGVNNDLSILDQRRLTNEYQEVVDALKKAFPGMSEDELEKAVISYLKGHKNQELSDIGVQDLIREISKSLNVNLSAETIASIKDEWEDLTQSMDIGVSDLAGVLDSYASGELNTGREYLIALWEMFIGEVGESSVEEAAIVAETDKKLHEKAFKEFVETQLEAMKKRDTDGVLGKVLKWIGAFAGLIGGVVSMIAGFATIAAAGWTGWGAAGGALMMAGGFIAACVGVAGIVSCAIDEASKGEVQWSLGDGLGLLIGHILQQAGADVDMDTVKQWTAFAVQMTLTAVSIALSLAGAGCTLISSFGSGLSGSVTAASKTVDAAAEAAKVSADIAEAGGKAAELVIAAEKAAQVLVEATKLLKIAKAVAALKILSNLISLFGCAASLLQAGVQLAKGVNTIDLAYTEAQLVILKALLAKLAKVRELDQELAQAILQIIFSNMRGQATDAVDTVLRDMEIIASMNLNKA